MMYTGDKLECNVKEMIEFLQQFNENDKVEIYGGEDWEGGFMCMVVNDKDVLKDLW